MPDLFVLESNALPTAATVAGFKGIEGLSTLYRFDIGVLTTGGEQIDLAGARGITTRLAIETAGEPMMIHGMIARIALAHAWQGQALYRLQLVPRLWAMTLTHQSRVFVDMTVPEIVARVLKDGGFGSDDFELKLMSDYARRPHVGQYKESRWNFIARLLEREGIYYFFDHSGDREKLVITDRISTHVASRDEPVSYVPLSGVDDAISNEAFNSFTVEHVVLPEMVRVRDFDPLKPALQIFGDADVWADSQAERMHLGDGCSDEASAVVAANVRAHEWLTQEQVYRGTGRAFPIRSGYRFAVDEHPVASLNREYLAVEVSHYGNQAAASELVRELLGLGYDDDYRFDVRASAHDQRFGPPRVTPTPRIYGLERAFVDGPADSDYAQIDEHGRYKVKMHFDVDDSDIGGGNASTWLRMLQPHGGNPEGLHFPLRNKTEVLVAHLGGDPDRPVIVGAVPNAIQPSPVTSDNHTQNVIQTGGLNRIEMEDLAGQQHIDISTPPQKTWIHLGEPHDSHGAYLHFHSGGNQLVNIGSDRGIIVGGSKTMDVAGTFDTKVGGNVTLEGGANYQVQISADISFDNGGNYDITTGGHQAFNCGADFLVSSGANIAFDNPGTFSVKSGGNQSFETGGDFLIDAAGNFGFTAGGSFKLTAAGNVAVDCAGPFEANVGGAVTITGPSVTVNTPTATLNTPKESWVSAHVDIQMGDELKIAGMSITATGLKVSTYGVNLASHGFKLETQGVRLNNAGVESKTAGLESKATGLLSRLSGLYSFA